MLVCLTGQEREIFLELVEVCLAGVWNLTMEIRFAAVFLLIGLWMLYTLDELLLLGKLIFCGQDEPVLASKLAQCLASPWNFLSRTDR